MVPCRYLDLGSYAEWDEEKRIEFLTRELEGKRPLIPTAMPMTNDVREVRLRKASSARPTSKQQHHLADLLPYHACCAAHSWMTFYFLSMSWTSCCDRRNLGSSD